MSEIVRYLVSVPDGIYVDGTVGGGGHSLAIEGHLTGKGQLICLDRDPAAVSASKNRLAPLGDTVHIIKANYADLDKVLAHLRCKTVDGVLLDLGMSSYQLDKSGKGFSFRRNEPLDMRMDPDDELTAYHLVNTLSAEELEHILKTYGEENRAKLISRTLVKARQKSPIETSSRLADVVKAVFPPSKYYRIRHPATRTFQALRIAVNRELENLETFLNKIPLLMVKGGRLVIISYHSLEDRLVKRAMVNWEKPCTCPPEVLHCVCGKAPLFKRLLKKAVRPDAEEIKKNPRARSAVLRVAERV